MIISLDVTAREFGMIEDYAQKNGMEVSEVLLSAVLDKLEDEADAEYCDRVIDNFMATGKARSLKDINEERGGF